MSYLSPNQIYQSIINWYDDACKQLKEHNTKLHKQQEEHWKMVRSEEECINNYGLDYCQYTKEKEPTKALLQCIYDKKCNAVTPVYDATSFKQDQLKQVKSANTMLHEFLKYSIS